MTEKDYGYVAATFSEMGVDPFEKLTKEACSEDDLYYSNSISYIKGNVSSSLHLTIFYGLIDENLDKNELDGYIRSINLPSLMLGELVLKPEYNNFCQILWVQVLDMDHKLQKISEGFKRFEYERSIQLGFVPHLTLAYVKPDYKLGKLPPFPRKIYIKEIKYFEK